MFLKIMVMVVVLKIMVMVVVLKNNGDGGGFEK